MPYLPEEWTNELLSKTDMVALVSDYVSLSSKGGRFWGCCPFHNEKTPSFSVRPDKQYYYCFGCHKGGGVISFMMDIENLPYMEAVKRLAERAGMELPDDVNDEKLRAERAYKERLYSACKEAGHYFFSVLKGDEGKEAREYLARRGVAPAIAARFGLGFSPDSWDKTTDHLIKAGFSEKELVDAGLAIRRKDNSGIYSSFRGRLMFPIISAQGRVLGFGARTMKKDEQPKYINTGDTLIYNKRNNLYAINTQRGRHGGELIMVEGYMDVISLHAAGIDTAIASLGTAMTPQQARLAKRYSENVYLCYDGDAPGINAAKRGIDVLTKEGIDAKVITIPGDMDPDDYVKKYGKGGFLRLRDSAHTANGFRIECMAKEFDLGSENGREGFAKKACAFVGSLQPVERERYAPVIARKTGLPIDAVRAQCAISPGEEISPGGERNTAGKSRNTKIRQESHRGPEKAELMLAACMLKDAESAAYASSRMAEEKLSFESAGVAALAEALLIAWSAGETPDIPSLLASLPPEDNGDAAAVLAYGDVSGDTRVATDDCIRNLMIPRLEAEITELTRSAAGLSGAERDEVRAKLREKSAMLIKYKSKK